jgi:transcriptional regulator with XRE-family HTH domain
MKAKANVRLIDPRTVRHRRMELGLTESYLGALCGVSSSVIRRLEGGWPQDDLSARFLDLLAGNLGTTLADLLTTDHRNDAPEHIEEGDTDRDARDLGAVLLRVGEPVPLDALCQVLDWDLGRLDHAAEALIQALEPAGAILVDNGATLRIAGDLTPVDRGLINAAAAATFARRRPNLPELRAVLTLLDGKAVRTEDMDTLTGHTLGRLRNLGVLSNADTPAGVKSDAPRLHDDVTYSLMIDER